MSGLGGRRVVVTRAREQSRGLVERLRVAGAEVVEIPTIAVADPTDGGAALREAASSAVAGRVDWVAFTSANAVERFAAALGGRTLPPATRVAAVGPGTAGALAAQGLRVDLVARRSTGEGLAAEMPEGTGTVLLPQAAAARDALARGLEAKGWSVNAVVAYRTVGVPVDAAAAAEAAAADAIAFTSASTVRSFLDSAGASALPRVVACIGPLTAAAAIERGVRVSGVAQEHSLDGLVACLERELRDSGGEERPGGD